MRCDDAGREAGREGSDNVREHGNSQKGTEQPNDLGVESGRIRGGPPEAQVPDGMSQKNPPNNNSHPQRTPCNQSRVPVTLSSSLVPFVHGEGVLLRRADNTALHAGSIERLSKMHPSRSPAALRLER